MGGEYLDVRVSGRAYEDPHNNTYRVLGNGCFLDTSDDSTVCVGGVKDKYDDEAFEIFAKWRDALARGLQGLANGGGGVVCKNYQYLSCIPARTFEGCSSVAIIKRNVCVERRDQTLGEHIDRLLYYAFTHAPDMFILTGKP